MSASIELTAGANLVTFEVKKEDLKRFTMKELRDTREAMALVGDVLSGLLCQHRYISHRQCTYNAAGDVLDLIQTLTLRVADAIEDEAVSRTEGLSRSDANARAFLLLMAMAEREDVETEGPSVGELARALERGAS